MQNFFTLFPALVITVWLSSECSSALEENLGKQPPKGNNVILSKEKLIPNESRVSPSGRWTLIYQPDGNLVLYDTSVHPWKPRWDSKTSGKSAGRCEMQGDGNLVIYDAAGADVWSSETSGFPGAWCNIQDDGNFVLYRPLLGNAHPISEWDAKSENEGGRKFCVQVFWMGERNGKRVHHETIQARSQNPANKKAEEIKDGIGGINSKDYNVRTMLGKCDD